MYCPSSVAINSSCSSLRFRLPLEQATSVADANGKALRILQSFIGEIAGKERMSAPTKSQKAEAVRQVVAITKAIDTDAQRLLKANRWQVHAAVDAFYDDGQAMANAEAAERKRSGPDKSLGNLTAMFDHYAGKGAEEMDFDATAAWCNDLGVDLESDVVIFALAELTKAPRMGYFERKAWIEGWRSERKDSIDAQKAHLDTLRKRFSSEPEYFKKVYAFCFDYAKESGQKSLALEIAGGIWPLLYSQAPPTLFEADSAFAPGTATQASYLRAWISFLQNEKKGRSVSRDLWTLFLDYTTTIDPKFENFDEDAAWPSLIDEYTELCKQKLANGEPIGQEDEQVEED